MVMQFFLFNVDYSRVERVQFEDDEYYYYVKAVPKMTFVTPERTVKKINRSRYSRSEVRRVVADNPATDLEEQELDSELEELF